MTTAAYIRSCVIPAAYALLPARMESVAATLLLLAIGFQESHFEHRRQMPTGPARSWWQNERGSIAGVLRHPRSAVEIQVVLLTLRYPATVETCLMAVEDNDVLAAVFARLLLWTDPRPLPPVGDVDAAYAYYDRNWRPGKKRPEDWPESYLAAREMLGPMS